MTKLFYSMFEFISTYQIKNQPISWSLLSGPFEPLFSRKWSWEFDKSIGLHSSSVPFCLLLRNNPDVLEFVFSFEIPLFWELPSLIPELLDLVGEIRTLISVASGIILFAICPLIDPLRKRLKYEFIYFNSWDVEVVLMYW